MPPTRTLGADPLGDAARGQRAHRVVDLAFGARRRRRAGVAARGSRPAAHLARGGGGGRGGSALAGPRLGRRPGDRRTSCGPTCSRSAALSTRRRSTGWPRPAASSLAGFRGWGSSGWSRARRTARSLDLPAALRRASCRPARLEDWLRAAGRRAPRIRFRGDRRRGGRLRSTRFFGEQPRAGRPRGRRFRAAAARRVVGLPAGGGGRRPRDGHQRGGARPRPARLDRPPDPADRGARRRRGRPTPICRWYWNAQGDKLSKRDQALTLRSACAKPGCRRAGCAATSAWSLGLVDQPRELAPAELLAAGGGDASPRRCGARISRCPKTLAVVLSRPAAGRPAGGWRTPA